MRFHVISGALLILTALGAIVVAADSGGADLLKAAKSGDESARIEAIDLLGFEGSDVEGSVPLLIELLGDKSPAVRAHAAHALGQIGPDARAAMRPLVRAAVTRDMMVRREVIKAIRKIRPHSPIALRLLARAMGSDDPAVRAQAMGAMTRAGKLAVPMLIRALGDEKTDYWASLVLAEIGPDAAEAVPALMKVVKDDDEPEDRREAILALGAIGPASAPAVAVLIDVIDKRVETLVGPAVFAIGQIGPKAEGAQLTLEKLAKDPDTPKKYAGIVTASTTWALAKINPDDKELAAKALSLLAGQLKSDNPEVRQFAVHALIDLNLDPEVARPVIDKVLEDASPEALNHVISAFVSLRGAGVPDLIGVLEDEKLSAVRPRVAAILGRMGTEAKSAIPVLTKVVADKNPVARREALFALAQMGPDAKEAVPAAIKALDDENEDIRYAACFVLGRVGPDAIDAKAKLVKNLGANNEMLAMISAWALARIDPKCADTSTKSVPMLIKAADHHNLKIQLEAIETLGCLGPLAKSALPALKKLAEDDDKLVSEEAAKAIKAIEQ